MDLIVVQSDLGFLEQLLMGSRMDIAHVFVISSLAVRHAARYARRSGSTPAFLSFNSPYEQNLFFSSKSQ